MGIDTRSGFTSSANLTKSSMSLYSLAPWAVLLILSKLSARVQMPHPAPCEVARRHHGSKSHFKLAAKRDETAPLPARKALATAELTLVAVFGEPVSQ